MALKKVEVTTRELETIINTMRSTAHRFEQDALQFDDSQTAHMAERLRNDAAEVRRVIQRLEQAR